MSEANEPFLGMQMLWNWYTVDSCFISRTWRITSKGMFAGSCIGVICLVICLEGLRRAQREYDAYLVRQYHMQNIQVWYLSVQDGRTQLLSVNFACEDSLTSAGRVVHHLVRAYQRLGTSKRTTTLNMTPIRFPSYRSRATQDMHSSRSLSVLYRLCSSRLFVP